ncbi:putative lipid phosphate phosphatase 3, chloroplastic [Golovinomyces cichoracearum]|uniref:Putative lipid phosphate phosphatase 3, chloroplastic n=1 Tax=Golovinomyces cichoracearum TaxID=62708 RepID=A0A420HP23_9PEZI|nr:putative lipid phosphate phosphatase 3, chloroplastic [Golovinomyces cichoracearum]
MGYQRRPSNLTGHQRLPVKLILSYVFDWIIVFGATIVGTVFAHMTPNKRPFSLANPEIAFPFQNNEKVPTKMLGIYVVAIPAFVIYIICIVLVPGPTAPKSTPRDTIWSRRLWEWHAGWLGLFFSLSTAFLITSGMKNLFGKPRPDLLSRCIPDISNLEKFKLGGFLGTDVVSADICTQKNLYILNDGFRSYPSGHASFSAGGLIYLSLFIASKLAITIPYLSPSTFAGNHDIRHRAFPSRTRNGSSRKEKNCSRCNDQNLLNNSFNFDEVTVEARNEAAAPPVYLLIFAIVPFFASIYISSTRYSDFRHHGFDILFGYMIGLISAIFSFRLYHLPINQGAGWAWGPRSSERCFWAGVGVGTYAKCSKNLGKIADSRESQSATIKDGDIEAGVNEGTMNNDHLELLPMQVNFDPVEIEFLPSKSR